MAESQSGFLASGTSLTAVLEAFFDADGREFLIPDCYVSVSDSSTERNVKHHHLLAA